MDQNFEHLPLQVFSKRDTIDEGINKLGKIMPKTRAELCFHTQQGEFVMNWFRLQQSLNFQATRIISFHLGAMIYMQGKNSTTEFIPRLDIDLSPYFKLEILAGLNTQGLGLVRNFTQKFGTCVFLGINRGNWVLELETIYRLKENINLYGNINSLGKTYFAYRHKFSRGYTKLFIRGDFTHEVLGFECKVKLNEEFSVFSGIEKSLDDLNTVQKWSFGLQMTLGQYLRLGHFIETYQTCVYWKFRLKRGSFCLDIPVKLGRLSTLLTCFGVCAITYLTKQVHKLIFSQKNSEIKEHKKYSEEFVRMVVPKVRENVENENNKGGLVVLQALYGNIDEIKRYLDCGEEASGFIDVTLAVNFMVEESKLVIPKVPKEGLQGFWWVSNDASLYIYYKLRGEVSKVILKNEEYLLIQ